MRRAAHSVEDRAGAAAAPAPSGRLSPLRGHAIADEPQGEEVDELCRHRRHRRAVGPLLELADHARPAAQGQERLRDEFLAVIPGHAQPVEFPRRALGPGKAAGLAQGRRKAFAPRRPRAEPARIQLRDGGPQAALPPRQLPVRHSLVEKGGAEPDQQRVHEGVGVEPGIDRDEEVAMAHRHAAAHHRRAGQRHGLHARLPEFTRRAVLVTVGRVEQPPPRLRRQAGPQGLDDVALRERPADGEIRLLPHGMEEEGPVEIPQADAAAGDGGVGGTSGIGGEHRVDVGLPNAARSEFFTVAALREKRLCAQEPRRVHHRLLEGLLLEGMERVVVDEDVDRALGRQEVGRVLDGAMDLLEAGGWIHRTGCGKRAGKPTPATSIARPAVPAHTNPRGGAALRSRQSLPGCPADFTRMLHGAEPAMRDGPCLAHARRRRVPHAGMAARAIRSRERLSDRRLGRRVARFCLSVAEPRRRVGRCV